jgi:hypothetical protein
MTRVSDAMAETDKSAEVNELRGALNRTLLDLDKAKKFREQMVNATYRAMRDSADAMTIPSVSKPDPDRRKVPEEYAVLSIGDWQYGKLTPTYTSEVCEQRVSKLVTKVRRIIDIHRKWAPVRKLHVLSLGDFHEGELIFPGQQHRIDASLYRQLTNGTRMYTTLLRQLAAHVDLLTAWEIDGNHGAIGGSQRREMHPESNSDRLMYAFSAMLTEGEKRIVHQMTDPVGEANWYHVAEIGNYRTLLVHGQEFRGTAGMPWYSVQKHAGGWALGAIEEWADAFRVGGDVDIDCGHWHQPTRVTLNKVTFRCNGSTESANTYAQQQLASVGRPSQSLRFVDPIKGRVTAEYCLYLD